MPHRGNDPDSAVCNVMKNEIHICKKISSEWGILNSYATREWFFSPQDPIYPLLLFWQFWKRWYYLPVHSSRLLLEYLSPLPERWFHCHSGHTPAAPFHWPCRHHHLQAEWDVVAGRKWFCSNWKSQIEGSSRDQVRLPMHSALGLSATPLSPFRE